MGAVIRLDTLSGMLIEVVDNGFIIRGADTLHHGGFTPPPVRVAETAEKLGEIVAEWATKVMNKDPS